MIRAVVTVVGKDTVGILAKVADRCAASNANVVDVSQTVMDDIFSMVMLIDIEKLSCDFDKFVASMKDLAREQTLKIHVMHEDIFNSMHRV